MIETVLERIANALEEIRDHLASLASEDAVEAIPVPTLTKPPLAWFDAGNGCAVAVEATTDDGTPVAPADGLYPHQIQNDHNAKRTGQTTWEWLGITPPATRTRSKNPQPRSRGAERGNTRAGQCGRCGREGRRRLNFKPFCIDCEHEPEWDE